MDPYLLRGTGFLYIAGKYFFVNKSGGEPGREIIKTDYPVDIGFGM